MARQSDMEHELFNDIFREYKDRIYGYVLLVVKSPDAAEELTQEILVKLWLCREELTKVNNLDGYIYKVARNKSLNHLRRAAYDLRLLEDLKSHIPDEYNNVDDRMVVKDYQLLLDEAVALLSPQRKRVYELSRDGGLNHDEIASELNLSKNTVKNHLVEALRLIRNYLNEHGGTLLLLTVYMLS